MSVRIRRAGSALTAVALGGALLVPVAGCRDKGPGRPKTAATSDSSAVLAWVGDRALTIEDVRNFMKRTTPSSEIDVYLHNADILQVALSSLVDQFVWGEIARQEGYRLSEREQIQVDALEAEFLATRYVADVVDKLARPTESQVEEYYKEHGDQFMLEPRVAARHILVSTKAEADRIRREAESGRDFQELVRAHSRDAETRDLGGALGYITPDGEVVGVGRSSAFNRAVLVLQPGEVTVVESVRGWHVVKAERKEGGVPRPLEEVRAEIEGDLRMEHYAAIYNDQLAAARDKVGARYNSAGFEKMTGVPDNCERLIQMADSHPETPGRIELYRRVAFDFPDCDQAGYAQFMIGYLFLTGRRDAAMAGKALQRLYRTFPESPWRAAGEYLQKHMNEDPETLGTPEEIRQRAGG